MQETETFVLNPGTSREYLLYHGLCPVGICRDGVLRVLASTRCTPPALDDLEFIYRRTVRVEYVEQDEIERAVERLATRSQQQLELQRVERADDVLATDVRSLACEPPVIRYVNMIVRDGYDAGASDIHFETTPHGLHVRFRIDGMLVRGQSPRGELDRAIVSRLKLLADLDIAERRRPQDGRIRVRLHDRELDIRISTVPSVFGESIVLRLLEHGGRLVELSQLGMPPPVLEDTSRFLKGAHGLMLVTGPTGSGKTTTLYSALRMRDAETEKIVTVEDPVEYQLEGVTQVPVQRQAGVTFAAALRSILRQDPDVVMVGEIRDGETAQVSVQAAMTGHLVLATLHTNDAVGAVARLVDLGIPPYMVAATLNQVIAQRLVRRVCGDCGASDAPRSKGCARCRGSGFSGRIGIFEHLRMTRELKAATAAGRSSGDLAQMWRDSGGEPMAFDGNRKAKEGITTADEVLRVTSEDDA